MIQTPGNSSDVQATNTNTEQININAEAALAMRKVLDGYEHDVYGDHGQIAALRRKVDTGGFTIEEWEFEMLDEALAHFMDSHPHLTVHSDVKFLHGWFTGMTHAWRKGALFQEEI